MEIPDPKYNVGDVVIFKAKQDGLFVQVRIEEANYNENVDKEWTYYAKEYCFEEKNIIKSV